MVPFLKQPNPHQLSVRRENVQQAVATFSHFAHLVGHESNMCTGCSAGNPSPILANAPADFVSKCGLWHPSEYLRPLGSTWVRFLKIWRGGVCLEENQAVINKLDHNQPITQGLSAGIL